MVEVQSHGFSFEKWVRGTFFGGYRGNYGQEWDVPAANNIKLPVPVEYQGLPVSIKTAKFGTPIGMGDALRQVEIDVPFLMIVGFWNQRTPSQKWYEAIGCVRFEAAEWSSLWGRFSMRELRTLDELVKNLGQSHQEVRRCAKEWKKNSESLSTSKMVINPKIDSKKQRRVQCSLPFSVFWKHAGIEPTRVDRPVLFGVTFKNPVFSRPRRFNS